MKLPNWIIQTTAALVLILLALLAVGQAYAIKGKIKGIETKNTITISAEGKVVAAPDLATIVASVTTKADTADGAQKENTKKLDKVLAYVKGLGINGDDIKTQYYNLYPEYNYIGGVNVLNGYRVSQTLSIKTKDREKVAKVLDGIVTNGANEIQSVTYGFDDIDKFRQQAREKALASAKEKAENLAKAAGARLGKLVSFSEANTGGYPTPMYYGERGHGGGGGVPTEPGTQDIYEQVNVIYELK